MGNCREPATKTRELPRCQRLLTRRRVIFSQPVRSWLDRRGIRLSCPSHNDLVTNIKRIVASAPEVNWPAPDVAARLAMSEATMRRRLARTGTSLSKILLETRMLAALTLLQAGDQSVVQIAYAVGYESPSRFAGRFRERFGFAPSELRKRGS